MAKYPALPIWTDALLGDTLHLSRDEFGAYMLLLFTAWRRPKCDLPDDDAFLAKIARCDPRKWVHMRPIMAQFHVIERGTWVQKRLQKERNYVDEHSAKQSKNASSRWNKNNNLTYATAMPNACQTNAPTPTPTPTPIEDISSLRSDTTTQSEAIDLAEAMAAYNEAALSCGWAQAAKLTQPRIKALRARIGAGGLEEWRAAMIRATRSDFLSGRAPRSDGHGGWAPDLDWFIKAKNFTKLLEGSYDNRKPAKRPTATDNFLAGGLSYIEDLQREIDGINSKGSGDIQASDAFGDDLLRPRLLAGTGEGSGG